MNQTALIIGNYPQRSQNESKLANELPHLNVEMYENENHLKYSYE